MVGFLANGAPDGLITSRSDDCVPTVIGTTAAGVGTYSVQEGRFLLLGTGGKAGVCLYTINLTRSAHTGTGLLRVNGDFPYEAVSGMNFPAAVKYNNLTFPAD